MDPFAELLLLQLPTQPFSYIDKSTGPILLFVALALSEKSLQLQLGWAKKIVFIFKIITKDGTDSKLDR